MHTLKKHKTEADTKSIFLSRCPKFVRGLTNEASRYASRICFARRLGEFKDAIVVASSRSLELRRKYSDGRPQVDQLQSIFSSGSCGSASLQIKSPAGVCVQPFTNHLIVSDCDDHLVKVLDVSKIRDVDTYDFKLHGPIFSALFTIGAGNEGINGSDELGKFKNPFGVCCSHRGDVFVADVFNNRVQQFDCKGRFVRVIGSNVNCKSSRYEDCFSHPRALVIESTINRRLIVADWNNFRLSLWDQDAKQHLVNIAVEGLPLAVCVDLNGCILVSSDNNTVQIFDPINLKLLQVLGTPSERHEGSKQPGGFTYPSGLCVDDDNNLYVCDGDFDRLQVF